MVIPVSHAITVWANPGTRPAPWTSAARRAVALVATLYFAARLPTTVVALDSLAPGYSLCPPGPVRMKRTQASKSAQAMSLNALLGTVRALLTDQEKCATPTQANMAVYFSVLQP